MTILEVIAEIFFRVFLELIMLGLSYWTGYFFLKGSSRGAIRLAPLSSFREKNRSKQKWHQIDWSIWLHRPMQQRMLKAECTCLVGVLVWGTIGFAIHIALRDGHPTTKKTSHLTFDPPQTRLVMTDGASTRERRVLEGRYPCLDRPMPLAACEYGNPIPDEARDAAAESDRPAVSMRGRCR